MADAFLKPRLRLALLAIGAATGLLLAASGIIKRWSAAADRLPENAIARVGGQIIPAERYLQLLHDLAADKRAPLSAQDRKYALDRLIDEELLIQRGIELGLPSTSPAVRKSLAAEVIAQVAAESEATAPSDDDLLELYHSDSAFFTPEAHYRVQWWRLRGTGPEAERQAMAAYRLLGEGKSVEEVTRSTGLQRETMLPDQMLTLTKLADYLGPELARRVIRLEPGSYSRPEPVNGGYQILYLAGREAGRLPPFEQIRAQVEAEFLRRAGDRALRDYLEWLRGRSEITVAADAPP